MGTFKKRRVSKKRTTRRRKVSLTRKVKRLARRVRQFAPEIKHMDATSSQTFNNDFSAIDFPLRSITQGVTDFGERIGDKIHLRSILVRMNIDLGAGFGTLPYRIIVFAFKNNPDAITTSAATIGNLFMASTNANTNLAQLAVVDWDNHKSFELLYDRKGVVEPSNIGATTPNVRWLQFKIPLPASRRSIEWIASGTTPVHNDIGVMFLGQQDSGLTARTQYRITYTDA